MGLTEKAQLDNRKITGSLNGWGVAINIVDPNAVSVDIVGLHTKHHIGYDADGVRMSTKTASVSITESFLTDAGYPVRNGSLEVDMVDHLVNVNDSTDILKNYIVLESFPDEKLGMIILILGDFE